MSYPRAIPLLLFLFCAPSGMRAQQPVPPAPPPRPGAVGVEEATALTQAWALLAQGLTAEASRRAAQVLAAYPRSAGAIALAVETEIARAGSVAGLDQYERWLGSRALEEPSIVRRVAVALLHEMVSAGPQDAARLQALRALAADGDAAAATELSKALETGSVPELRALAATGNETAVKALAARLNSGSSNLTSTIEALAQSGSKLALAPLTERLQDRAPEVRGAAVEGLGTMGDRFDVIDRIKPMLEDKTGYVRIKAAAALFRLGDMSGLSMLQELYAADAEASRLIAVKAMASAPDSQWLDQVRRLTSAEDPAVRVEAARLIAPHDRELARRSIEQGMADPNPAVREMAAEALSDVVSTDLRALRHLLRLPDRLARVRAAAHILALVR